MWRVRVVSVALLLTSWGFAQGDAVSIGGITAVVPGPGPNLAFSYFIPTTLSKLIGDSRASVFPSVDEAFEALADMAGVEGGVPSAEQLPALAEKLGKRYVVQVEVLSDAAAGVVTPDTMVQLVAHIEDHDGDRDARIGPVPGAPAPASDIEDHVSLLAQKVLAYLDPASADLAQRWISKQENGEQGASLEAWLAFGEAETLLAAGDYRVALDRFVECLDKGEGAWVLFVSERVGQAQRKAVGALIEGGRSADAVRDFQDRADWARQMRQARRAEEAAYIWIEARATEAQVLALEAGGDAERGAAARAAAANLYLDYADNTPNKVVRWQYEMAERRGCLTYLVSDNTAYIGAAGGVVHAVDLQTGREVWRRSVGHRTVRFLDEHDGVLYFFGTRGVLDTRAATDLFCAVDASTGAVHWQQDAQLARLLQDLLPDAPEPIITADTILLAGDSKVLALDIRTGSPRWTWEDRPALVYGVAAREGRVWIAARRQGGARVLALDIRSGEEVWCVDDEEELSGQLLTGTGDRVYVGFVGGRLRALNSSDGASAWDFDAGASVVTVDAAEGCLYVIAGSAKDRTLHALDAETGNELWEFGEDTRLRFGGTSQTGLTLVWSGQDRGQLCALDAKTGEVKWRLSEGGLSGVQVVVVGDTVYAPFIETLRAVDAGTRNVSMVLRQLPFEFSVELCGRGRAFGSVDPDFLG